MTHNLHILLGNCAEQNISNIKKYAIKYGGEYVDSSGLKAKDYLRLMLFDDNCQFHEVKPKEVPDSVFVSGIDDDFDVELKPLGESMPNGDSSHLIHFFDTLFTNTVTMNNPGDGNMHVCLHVPLYSDAAWADAEAILSAINATGHKHNFTVDLLLLASLALSSVIGLMCSYISGLARELSISG